MLTNKSNNSVIKSSHCVLQRFQDSGNLSDNSWLSKSACVISTLCNQYLMIKLVLYIVVFTWNMRWFILNTRILGKPAPSKCHTDDSLVRDLDDYADVLFGRKFFVSPNPISWNFYEKTMRNNIDVVSKISRECLT